MKKATIFTVVCMLAFAGSLMAFDDLINDWGGVNEARTLNLDAHIVYRTASKAFDKDGDKFDADATNIRIPINVRYGITDKISALAILPIVSTKNGDSESGIGDAWIGLKCRVLPENLLNARIAVELPLGDDDKGLGNPGGLGFDAGVSHFCVINESISVAGQAGLRFATEDSDTKWKPGMMFYLVPAASYRIRDGLSVGANIEFMMGGDAQLDGTDVDDSGFTSIEPWLFVQYQLPNDMWLTGAIGNTVSGKNISNDLDIYFRLGKGFEF